MGGARSRNIGWRLDYFVISKRALPNLVDSYQRSYIMGSEYDNYDFFYLYFSHCPSVLHLKKIEKETKEEEK
jgi:exonuclease III